MIGIVGLGNMGNAIAQRLIAEGESVTVWNRTTTKSNDLASQNSASVSVAASPAAVVNESQVIISILANDVATQSVYFEPDGLLSAQLNDKVIVEMCTMAPARAIELEQNVLGKQGLFLECPVGGTVAPALEGKLLGLAGGSNDAFTKANPVLNHLTRRLEHFGPVGNGAAMKLAVNLPLLVYWAALGEALDIARSHNVDAAKALDVLADSSGAIGVAKKRLPAILDMLENSNSGTTSFSLKNAIKDMELMKAVAIENGGSHAILSQTLEQSKLASKAGLDGIDCSLVAALNKT